MKNPFAHQHLSFPQLLQQAHKKQEEKKYHDAAHMYLQCSEEEKLDIRKKSQHLLHAAQCFERDHDIQESSNYYLKSAELFSESNYLQHSLSALKAYYRINKNKTPIDPILNKLRAQGLWHDDMLELLSEEEKIFQIISQSKHLDRSLFAPAISFEEFQHLMKWINLSYANKGDILTKIDDDADTLYLIVQGEVEIFIPRHTSMESMGIRTDMDMFGEVEFFLQQRWTTQAIALSDCCFLSIPYKNIIQIKHFLPNIKPCMAKSYCHRIILQRLATSAIFSELKQDIRENLAHHISITHLTEKEILFKAGDQPTHVYTVISGQIGLFLNIDDQSVPFKRINAHATLGETAIMNQNKRTITAMALQDSYLLSINAETFLELHEKNHELRWLLRIRKDFQLKEV
ncbi:MAG: cyclic nucleotide-binding domain-containing protein, partial [Mariprofundaceae bacterium]|nr:cyclic nucleotide-binding domain-containing protein [Mariprofundaceae bacterium]